MTTDLPPNSNDALPNLCGSENLIARAMASKSPVFLPEIGIDFRSIRSAFAIALHMHQPLIPAGGGDLQTAAVIGNLQFMMEHPEVPDAHNWSVFRSCYGRMGDFIPELVNQGLQPRMMLDYSGCLFHGLAQMGANDVLDRLKLITHDARYRHCVEWLGTTWGHAVAPSTPVQDFRLHVRAWQHHFASIFGLDALSRVRGFSPPEMALPNHPDVAHAFVKTLVDCGYRWVMVQEDSVEQAEDGGPVRRPHVPHRLVARNSRGESATIVALIKTRGSDNKLVAQMQPYYEAKGLSRTELGGISVPPVVSQIGDGENGGVMMNEFPPMFFKTIPEASGSASPPMNGTEYLEYLQAAGVSEESFPAIQPILQKRIWDRLETAAGPERLDAVIKALRKEDGRFHMEGGSWTSSISWVRGYDNVLGPMESVSALFAEKVKGGMTPEHPSYRNALYHLLMTQTSCYRYWGQGTWTDYGRELCRRAETVLRNVS
jgi:hypothetical protein